jgi:hypothetical protein
MDSISEEYGVDQAATGSVQSEPVVSVRGLVKRYGSHEAVAGIDLEVRRGEISSWPGAGMGAWNGYQLGPVYRRDGMGESADPSPCIWA